MREKLIELLKNSPYLDVLEGLSYYEEVADHLIANGVTFAEDTNVPSKWISVSERLPEKMGKYVCRYVFGEEEGYPFEQVLWYYPNLEKPHFQHEGSMGLRVTHWMPLPLPPKEGE